MTRGIYYRNGRNAQIISDYWDNKFYTLTFFIFKFRGGFWLEFEPLMGKDLFDPDTKVLLRMLICFQIKVL